MKKLSVIIPVYFNENNLIPFYNDIKTNFIEKIDFDYELVFVDDGSKDKSWDILRDIAKENPKVITVKLSRNFGSHAAILCGLAHCTGDCAVIKAADLQEPTSLLINMYQKWTEGYNVVLATRAEREDSSFFSNFYYWLVQKTALPSMPKDGFDIYLVDKKVIDVLVALDENNSALTCQILWSGFKTATVPYTRVERTIGKSKWTLKKKIKLVSDTLFSFSNVPITIIKGIGFFACALSVAWALVALYGRISGNILVEGYTTLIIFQLFSFGTIMFTLGILGSYIWRIFDTARNRPVYIIEEKENNEQ